MQINRGSTEKELDSRLFLFSDQHLSCFSETYGTGLFTVYFQQILAQMEAVVEKKTPKQPRFVQPLHNAEISEGQRFVSS